jgi:hypothetical protein
MMRDLSVLSGFRHGDPAAADQNTTANESLLPGVGSARIEIPTGYWCLVCCAFRLVPGAGSFTMVHLRVDGTSQTSSTFAAVGDLIVTDTWGIHSPGKHFLDWTLMHIGANAGFIRVADSKWWWAIMRKDAG